ncbi:uncharacterized protein PHALS_08908 [Plasmopara halstedii]|uniref:Uncharacterized protein n=1 Tax=Plasmopara halstedii TaxID=4781 RepID=A0A0N7L4J6_PLAHL|nr:uncharacterized protein PHALS_08908 [Plasmopara halstedii]CEG38859.1 hypothetical protein PHALS_08908 [Plasmopara halstedii]|eukprot:XP_024575228.1 hypothetical protein PHALS_08908 [Plasmopara halstedii]
MCDDDDEGGSRRSVAKGGSLAGFSEEVPSFSFSRALLHPRQLRLATELLDPVL